MLKGSCLCGAVHYEVDKLGPIILCHDPFHVAGVGPARDPIDDKPGDFLLHSCDCLDI